MTAVGVGAVLFSCLGLFGLASYLTERRRKEIGVRKVLGASTGHVLWKMIREFLGLVVIANVLGLGIVYFGWRRVLQTGLLFVSQMDAGTVVVSLSISLLTALTAVSSQVMKAAWANPADSLRDE